jgi:lipopolysaccharide/colanic/teichoic acid biosynthesis glycosyltransferase
MSQKMAKSADQTSFRSGATTETPRVALAGHNAQAMIASQQEFVSGNSASSAFAKIDVIASAGSLYAKRLMDITLSLAALPLALALGLPFAILIWLGDRHSPIYGGTRVGKAWKPYRQYKLRSMIVGAEKAGIYATPKSDPRITPVGRFIRRYKLDELPQLWNVLTGDMSLVGPRPNTLRECKMYSAEEKSILSATPGITDISSIIFFDEQSIINGASDPNLGYHQLVRPWKSRYCLLYLERRTLLVDLELVAITLLNLFSRSLALTCLQHVLRRMGAGQDLLSIARRERPLVPFAPPGMTAVVDFAP